MGSASVSAPTTEGTVFASISWDTTPTVSISITGGYGISWRIRGRGTDTYVYYGPTTSSSGTFTASYGTSYVLQAVSDGGWNNTGDSVFTVTQDVHTHSYSFYTTVDPTCTEQGYEIWRCSGCGDLDYRNYTNALGHNTVNTVVTPTCTEQGYTTHICSRCGATTSANDNYTSALGHNDANTVVAPTCTEQGYTKHICSRCGITISANDNYINALGHAWDDGEIILEPTYTEDGIIKYLCTRCGETRTEAIAKKVGSVRIYNGSTFDIYSIYVRGKAQSWDLYVPYIYNGSSWDLYS